MFRHIYLHGETSIESRFLKKILAAPAWLVEYQFLHQGLNPYHVSESAKS